MMASLIFDLLHRNSKLLYPTHWGVVNMTKETTNPDSTKPHLIPYHSLTKGNISDLYNMNTVVVLYHYLIYIYNI